MAKHRTRIRLDAFERKVEESLADYVPASEGQKKRILQAAAKTKTISLRVSEVILEDLKRKAAEEGLPYQTLISSILHKFSAGRLVDASAVRRVMAALKH